MRHIVRVILLSGALSGCAGLQFNEGYQPDAITYYDPEPFVQIDVASDCKETITPVTLPGRLRSVKLKSGFEASKLSVKMSNGMLTELGQDTDPSSVITAATGALKTIHDFGLATGGGGETKTVCPVDSELRSVHYDPDKRRLFFGPNILNRPTRSVVKTAASDAIITLPNSSGTKPNPSQAADSPKQKGTQPEESVADAIKKM